MQKYSKQYKKWDAVVAGRDEICENSNLLQRLNIWLHKVVKQGFMPLKQNWKWMLARLSINKMLGPTWLKVMFDLKYSKQLEKKTNQKQSGNWIKVDVKFGKCKWNWIQTWCLVVRWKHLSQKYYINMSLMLLRHISVVDVKLAKETHCKRWGLRSSCPLRVVGIETIDIFKGCYL